MEVDTEEPVRRAGLHKKSGESKLGKNPIGTWLTPEQTAKIIAALAEANRKVKLFRPK